MVVLRAVEALAGEGVAAAAVSLADRGADLADPVDREAVSARACSSRRRS